LPAAPLRARHEEGGLVDAAEARQRYGGCYVTVPTPFRDDQNLSVDFSSLQRHINFLVEGGVVRGNGLLLAGGAAGDFSTMTFEERVQVAAAVVEAAAGRVNVAMGAQTTSTQELVRLAKAAEAVGADLIQISPPFYFGHTQDDFYEYVMAAARASDVGIILYNTFWTSQAISAKLLERFADIDNIVSLKWSAPDTGAMEFEQIISDFSERFLIIDNQMRFIVSHMLGAGSIELHMCNFMPAWGISLWQLLEEQRYLEAQREMTRVAMPFMRLWREIEQWTSGDGYLDKLCMELVGVGSSRCRPPTRDARSRYREKAAAMLSEIGVTVVPAPRADLNVVAPRLAEDESQKTVG
jgi:dihydrodipicolinate synthase/N-acetylneuraminate lyase